MDLLTEVSTKTDSKIYKKAIISCAYEDVCAKTNSSELIINKETLSFPTTISNFMAEFPELILAGGGVYSRSNDYDFFIIDEKNINIFDKIRSKYVYVESTFAITIRMQKSLPIQVVKFIYPSISLMLSNFDVTLSRVAYHDGTIYMHPTFTYARLNKCIFANSKKNTTQFAKRLEKYSERYKFPVINPYEFENISAPPMSMRGSYSMYEYKDGIENPLRALVLDEPLFFAYRSKETERQMVRDADMLADHQILYIFSVHYGVAQIGSKFFEFNHTDDLRKLLSGIIKEKYAEFIKKIQKYIFINRIDDYPFNLPYKVRNPSGHSVWAAMPELYFMLKNKLPKPLRIIILQQYLFNILHS